MKEDDDLDYDENDPEYYFFEVSKMDILTIAIIGSVIVIFCMLLGCCCRSTRKGRVLSPPPVEVTVPVVQAPYPQQQYTVQAPYPGPLVVSTYPTQNASMPYPNAGAPYPAVAPYPTGTPYPTVTAYPAAGAPYPTAGAGYPAPSAPADGNTMPPPYEQAMKQAPYNPSMPH